MNFDSTPGNRVYHLPKSVSFNTKNGRESLRLIFENGFEEMKSKFLPGIFQQENSRMPLQTFRLFQEFSTETSKTTRN